MTECGTGIRRSRNPWAVMGAGQSAKARLILERWFVLVSDGHAPTRRPPTRCCLVLSPNHGSTAPSLGPTRAGSPQSDLHDVGFVFNGTQIQAVEAKNLSSSRKSNEFPVFSHSQERGVVVVDGATGPRVFLIKRTRDLVHYPKIKS